MLDRELLQQALALIQDVRDQWECDAIDCKKENNIIAAIEAELAKPEQEKHTDIVFERGLPTPKQIPQMPKVLSPKQEALDKKADNARELGLDYESEQSIVHFPSFMRKRIEQAMDLAINPKGMSVHDGKATVYASDLHRMLLVIDSALFKVIDKSESLIDGDTSDGYHTFNELYDFRKAYNAALFNEWAASGKYSVHKSMRHYNGEDCFGGGWFIVVAQLPNGQISNHYEMKDWELFQLPETEKAMFEYDNHTSADVLKRLYSLTMNEKNHD
jgi:hypothetical protein